MLVAAVSPEPLGTLVSVAAESGHWNDGKDCVMADAERIRRWVLCLVKEPRHFVCEHFVHQSHPFACWYK